MDKYKEFESINLNDLEYFFHFGEIKDLKKVGVENLSQLFLLSDEELLNLTGDSRSDYRIMTSQRLLKCKYLDEDPSIDIYNSDNKKSYEKLGFLTRGTFLCEYLDKENLNLFEFVRNCSNDSIYLVKAAKDMRNVPIDLLKTLYARAIIVVDYYNKHKDDNKVEVNNGNEKEILDSLYAELMRLREENARIDKQIGAILQKIEEMGKSDSKGGIKK